VVEEAVKRHLKIPDLKPVCKVDQQAMQGAYWLPESLGNRESF
jgi:hypothetical protein